MKPKLFVLAVVVASAAWGTLALFSAAKEPVDDMKASARVSAPSGVVVRPSKGEMAWRLREHSMDEDRKRRAAGLPVDDDFR